MPREHLGVGGGGGVERGGELERGELEREGSREGGELERGGE